MKSRISSSLWVIGALLSAGLALVSYRYLARVGPVPQNVAGNPLLYPWIFLHAGGAATALLVGPFQFLPRLRARWPKVHRWTGRTYVMGCLSGGLAGLIMAAGSTAGPVGQSGFATLAVLWIAINAQAWRLALQGRYAEHRRWMIRSFALTFGAVTLRLYLPIAPLLGFSFMDGYRAVAWLSWVPNLIAAEIYLARSARPARRCASTAARAWSPVEP